MTLNQIIAIIRQIASNDDSREWSGNLPNLEEKDYRDGVFTFIERDTPNSDDGDAVYYTLTTDGWTLLDMDIKYTGKKL